ncbi:hypothetical protein [Trinickia caryophylli]|nr:hypothetical protein [Trinickia caryophylli]PMS13582.1 hypothetical protein C0Z17_04700 [Trinickia caryophylli]
MVAVGTGMAIDRMSRLKNAKKTPGIDAVDARKSGPSHWSPLPATGDQHLSAFRGRFAPNNDSNIVGQALEAQIQKRMLLGEKVSTALSDPSAALQQLQQNVAQVGRELHTLRGAAKVATGEATISNAEAAEIARAAARDSALGAYGALKGLVKSAYAASTTSAEGAKQASAAVVERASHEAAEIGLGVGITNTVARGVSMIPHPAAKWVAAGIQVTGTMAAGAQISQTMHEIGGTSEHASATMQAMAKTLRSKVGDAGARTGDADVRRAEPASFDPRHW